MNLHLIGFLVLPYAAFVVAVVVTTLRALWRPSTMTSRTSQILESKKLYWGSVAFHWGIILVLLGHLAALLIPGGVELFNAGPLRLYILEATGFALGLWAFAGMLILSWRRLSDARVRVVTQPMDVAVLALLALSTLTGLLTAVLYRYGSSWFTAVFTPYLWSLVTLRPRPELVEDLPWLVKLHVLGFFFLLAAFPFSRLVHIVTLPLGYLLRPWQLVLWVRRPAASGSRR